MKYCPEIVDPNLTLDTPKDVLLYVEDFPDMVAGFEESATSVDTSTVLAFQAHENINDGVRDNLDLQRGRAYYMMIGGAATGLFSGLTAGIIAAGNYKLGVSIEEVSGALLATRSLAIPLIRRSRRNSQVSEELAAITTRPPVQVTQQARPQIVYQPVVS